MKETAEALAAFELYYRLGDKRTLEKLADALIQKRAESKPKNPLTMLSQVKRWSSAHSWQERLLKREQEDAEILRKQRLKEMEKMNEEHALLGRTQALRMAQHIKDLQESGELDATEAIKFFKILVDLERIARGAATAMVAHVDKDGEALPAAGAVNVHLFYPEPETQKGGDAH